MSFQDDDILKIWEGIFSNDDYRLKIADLAANYLEKKSIYVPYPDIDAYNPDFATYILEKPDRCIRLGEKVIRQKLPPTWNPEDNINLRVEKLPRDAHVEIRNLRSTHLGRLVALDGLVRKATVPKLKMTHAHYKCAKCDADIWVPQKGMYAKEPLMCTNDACNRGALKFNLDQETSIYSDTQKIEIQENPEGLRGGAQPERIMGYIEDDISGKITPGNRVTLNGIIRPVEKDRDKSIIFDVFVDIVSVEYTQEEYDEIEITEEDEKEILAMSKDPEFFDKLIKSIAPTIFGMKEVKQAVALQLFGGTRKKMDDDSIIRGDIHILLCGDPGVAKSQILSYMSRLAPRGIYASGKSASAAGLCVGADTYIVKESGELETIGDMVNSRMTAPEEYRPGIWRQAVTDLTIQSIGDLGSVRYLPVSYVWRIDTPKALFKITVGGSVLTLTPETKLQAMKGASFDWVCAKDLAVGDMVSTVRDNMRLLPISEIEYITDDLPDHVYDLTVEPSHAFVGNGFVIHNTAAAVKDDFGDGKWTLEAGALVLADKGLACIDELDKMTPQDRSSLHEAMESQKISIAKAGISATLQSRCSLLAAANPISGRFEAGEKIVGQIDLPPALMSRFDLIFALTDKPDTDYDTRLSGHILGMHERGQVKNLMDREVEGIDKEEILKRTEDIAPIYNMDIIRKYVSYAKQNCFPVMSKTAENMIQNEYLYIRNLGAVEQQVTITPRQLEAYIRLSEASAKSRLSPIVDERDATIAIQLVKFYLDKVAKTENDTYDVDMFGNEFTRKDRQRKKRTMDDIMMELDEFEDGMSEKELASKHPDISEDELHAILNRLSDNGQIYNAKGKWKVA